MARQLRRRVEANRLHGVDAEWLEPEDVKDFCPPINIAPTLRYPVIGAKVQTGRDEGTGAAIDEVVDGTPADRSGLQKGDVVTKVDGERVTDGISLIVAIRSHQPGETLEFTVERDGRERTISVTLDSEVG